MTTRTRAAATRSRASKVSRAAKSALSGKLRTPRPQVPDDVALAAAYDRERGYDRPRRERSKEAHEMAELAPVVRWTPPAARPTA